MKQGVYVEMEMAKTYKVLSKKTIVIAIGATLMISGTGYGLYKVNQPKEAEMMVAREREYPVMRGDITAGTNGSGVIKFQQIDQNFSEAVTIDEVYVKEGQRVKKGDKLASISSSFIDDKLKEINGELQKAKAAVTSAKNNKEVARLTQNKTIEDQALTSKNQYEKQRSAILKNLSDLKGKQGELAGKLADITTEIAELSKNQVENALKIDELKATKSVIEGEKGTVESDIKRENDNLNTLDTDRKEELKQESKNAASSNKINELSNSSLEEAIVTAEGEVTRIQTEISKVNKLKENMILYAEEDGVIMALNYGPGQLTTPEKAVVTLGTNKKIVAEMTVSQSDIPDIEVGQEVNLFTGAFEGVTFKGKVTDVNLKPNTQGGTTNYAATVEIDANDYELLDGMTVSGLFLLKEVKDVLVLSNKAITLKDGKQIVKLRQKDGKLEEKEITTGFSDGKKSEVISGLNDGDIVIVGGQ